VAAASLNSVEPLTGGVRSWPDRTIVSASATIKAAAKAAADVSHDAERRDVTSRGIAPDVLCQEAGIYPIAAAAHGDG